MAQLLQRETMALQERLMRRLRRRRRGYSITRDTPRPNAFERGKVFL